MNRVALLLTSSLLLGGCTMLGKIGQVMMEPSIAVGGPDDQPSQFSLSLYASAMLNINPDSTLVDIASPVAATPMPLSVNLSAQDPFELTQKLEATLEVLRRDYPAMSPVPPQQADMHAMSPLHPALAAYADSGIQTDQAVPEPAQPLDALATPVTFQILQLKDDSLLLDATYEQLIKNPEKALGTTLVRIDDYRLMPGHFKFADFEPLEAATRYLAVLAHYQNPESTDWKRALRIEPRGHRHAVLVQFEENGVVLMRERQ